MVVNLTQGAMMTMCNGNFSSEELEPVLQVIDVKRVQSQQSRASEKYRLVLSDGSYYHQGMLAANKNDLVHSGRLQKGSIVKLTEFICNDVQNRRIIIVVELDVVLDKCDLIGEPVSAPRNAPAQSATSQSGIISGNSRSLNSNFDYVMHGVLSQLYELEL